MSKRLDDLELDYRLAQSEYQKDRSDDNHKAYKKAKKKFADARTKYKQARESGEPDDLRADAILNED
jgi:hypothetical protein